jgi:hypothetical protein
LVTAAEVRPAGKEEVLWGKLTRSSPSSAWIRGYYLDNLPGTCCCCNYTSKSYHNPKINLIQGCDNGIGKKFYNPIVGKETFKALTPGPSPSGRGE